MNKDPKILLSHILESIEDIFDYISDMEYDDFINDKKTQDAVIRKLEIIGEAAKLIPESFKEKFNEIPWKEMVGMRDFLIHKYFGVDLDLVWATIEKDLPNLREKILRILKDLT